MHSSRNQDQGRFSTVGFLYEIECALSPAQRQSPPVGSPSSTRKLRVLFFLSEYSYQMAQFFSIFRRSETPRHCDVALKNSVEQLTMPMVCCHCSSVIGAGASHLDGWGDKCYCTRSHNLQQSSSMESSNTTFH